MPYNTWIIYFVTQFIDLTNLTPFILLSLLIRTYTYCSKYLNCQENFHPSLWKLFGINLTKYLCSWNKRPFGITKSHFCLLLIFKFHNRLGQRAKRYWEQRENATDQNYFSFVAYDRDVCLLRFRSVLKVILNTICVTWCLAL